MVSVIVPSYWVEKSPIRVFSSWCSSIELGFKKIPVIDPSCNMFIVIVACVDAPYAVTVMLKSRLFSDVSVSL